MLLLLLACAPKAPIAPAAEHPLLLWRVEREGRVSHLLGTCHVGVALDYALPAPHDAALTRAAVVYTEANLDLDDPLTVMRLVWSDGPPLSERLDPEDWRALAVHTRGTLPASVLDHLAPWALGSMLGFLGEGTPAGGALDVEPMDATVQKRARARKIPIRHVETLEQQAAVLATLDADFLKRLRPGSVDVDALGAAFDALSDLCLRTDLRGTDLLVEPGDPVADVLLRARNRAWMPTLSPALAEGGAFVAVGAGHLLGDDGLLELLAAEGYTTTQLTTTRPPSEARLADVGGHVPPAPPASPDLAAYEAVLAPSLAATLCAEGQLLRTCFVPDESTCRERVTTDAALCLRQHADRLPEGPVEPKGSLARELQACVPAGLLLESLANGRVGDAPMCTLLAASMRAGGGSGSGVSRGGGAGPPATPPPSPFPSR